MKALPGPETFPKGTKVSTAPATYSGTVVDTIQSPRGEMVCLSLDGDGMIIVPADSLYVEKEADDS